MLSQARSEKICSSVADTLRGVGVSWVSPACTCMGAIFDGPDLDRLRLKGDLVPRAPVMASGRSTLSDSEAVCRVVCYHRSPSKGQSGPLF